MFPVLIGAQAFYIAHVHAHTAGNHRICGHGSEPIVHMFHLVPSFEIRPFANKGSRLGQDLWGEALDLDLIETSWKQSMSRLPIIRGLTGGEESIGCEFLQWDL